MAGEAKTFLSAGPHSQEAGSAVSLRFPRVLLDLAARSGRRGPPMGIVAGSARYVSAVPRRPALGVVQGEGGNLFLSGPSDSRLAGRPGSRASERDINRVGMLAD